MNFKKFNLFSLPLLFISILFLYKTAHCQNAYEIVSKSQELLYANSTYTEILMEIIKPNWKRKYGMKIWALEPDYALIYITEPAKDKGTVTLKRKNEVWNFLPSIQKIIKIPPSMMNQSWMGSDFTNDDLVRSSSYKDDYYHKLIGYENFNNYLCYKIESIPKPDVGIVWGKIISLISKTEYMPLKTEFYDEEGNLIKSFIGSEIKILDGRKIPTYWEMISHDKPGNKTTLLYQKIKFNIRIDQSFFSQQNMTRIR